eukprot:CAMPEP_0197594388 /NCGR_PEP_ID=MMETSP1326-20131121/20426_1 /TAXON_ID=1155430 /ORGANISM="Genus nov. species nov., Strain RCC2288" /LENGTH=51 /DNA_ID=CAMNT_0043160551 /DNA_START=66 /DNA_END=221 /DNA_ORIENTATION=-
MCLRLVFIAVSPDMACVRARSEGGGGGGGALTSSSAAAAAAAADVTHGAEC